MKLYLPLYLTMVVATSYMSCPMGFVAPISRTPAAISNGTPHPLTSTVPSVRPRRDIAVGPLAVEKPTGKAEGADDQEPMDLNLEQMFEVFEAADQEISDETVGKKPDKSKANEGKDPAEAMGDMLSSFFGGSSGKK